METVKEVEWCATWDCPACKQSTDQILDHKSIEEWDGAIIKVTCHHDVDNGDHESPICKREYFVDLRG